MSAEQAHSPESLIDKPSKEAILWLVRRYPTLEELHITFYQRRLPDPVELTEKVKTGATDIRRRFSREQILAGVLNWLLENRESNKDLGINSDVMFKNGQKGQIPMMDFGCEIDMFGRRDIKEMIKTIGLSGFFIQASCSYHFIGKEIMFDNREWEKFLGKCLLTDLVDQRYIGHSLDAGYCTLRLSPDEILRREPMIIDFIL